MKGPARRLLAAELLVCFLPCAVTLVIGALMLPMQVASFLREPRTLEDLVFLVLMVGCGTIGFWSLYVVAATLFNDKSSIEHPLPVLGGMLLGTALLVLQMMMAATSKGEIEKVSFALTVVLPLLATFHIAFLSRHFFIAAIQTAKRPLISVGTWLTATIIVCLVALLLLQS